MKERLNIYENAPKALEILIEMEKYISTFDINIKLRELIKIRASQINKCAYCLEMHTIDAKKYGETEQRLNAIAAWEESPYFTDEERAALAFTEEVTRISEHGVKQNTFENLKKYFSEKQIAQMIIVINQINFWNRNAVTAKTLYKGH